MLKSTPLTGCGYSNMFPELVCGENFLKFVSFPGILNPRRQQMDSVVWAGSDPFIFFANCAETLFAGVRVVAIQ